VSDARIVLAKLATGMMAAIGITLAATVIGGLIAGLFELISEIFVPHSIILLSHPLAMLEGWGTVAYALTAQTIWFLPFFGWWMLASAWAKKAPFLWATLPPVLVVLAELILFRTHHFWDMMRMHVVNWMTILNIGPVMEGESGKDFMLQGDYLSMTGLGRYLASPELWIGTALGAAFIYAAIWLRRNRSEI
jgi:ABC-2 type transport system permease protein